MPYDKVVDSAVLESGLTSIANAIREKAGTSDALAFPAGFTETIAAIESVSLGTLTPYFYEIVNAEATLNVWLDFDFHSDRNYAVLVFQDLRTVASPPSAASARATVGFYYGSLGKSVSLDIIEMNNGTFGRGNLQNNGVKEYLSGLYIKLTYTYAVGVPFYAMVFEF